MLADLEREIKANEELGQEMNRYYKFNKAGYTFWNYNEDLAKLTSMEVDRTNYECKHFLFA